jgi:hypothetical protein
MRLRWNTTLGLIVIVAASAVIAAVAHAVSTALYGGRDNPLLGLGLVLASTGALCWVRTARELARRRARGEILSRLARASIFLASLGFALLTVGFSGLAFLVVFGMLTEMRWEFPHVTYDRRGDLNTLSIALVAATVAALCVAVLVRRADSADVSRRRRMVRLLAPLAIVALLVWGEVMRQTVVYRFERMAKHAGWAPRNRREVMELTTPGSHAAKLAEYHKQMRSKWTYFAWHPWFAAEPDPPEPRRVQRAAAR